MTPDLRWRFMMLQGVLIVVFAFGGGFLFWASNYTHSTIHDQLAAQQISFPAKSDAGVTPKALTPFGGSLAQGIHNSNAMKQYAGQTLTNGAQAKVYADSFIAVHLSAMGMTYSQASGKLIANPTNAKLQGLVATIFKGTTLRGMLLNSYGWWTMADYMAFAAIGAVIATLTVCFAFLYEALVANREKKATFALRGLAAKPAGI